MLNVLRLVQNKPWNTLADIRMRWRFRRVEYWKSPSKKSKFSTKIMQMKMKRDSQKRRKWRWRAWFFIKKFVQHILPSGFQKIRYFGIWASSNRKRKLAQAQRLLNRVPLQLTLATIKMMVRLKLGIDPTLCQHCGSANIVTEIVVPQKLPNRRMTGFKTRIDLINRPPPVDISVDMG